MWKTRTKALLMNTGKALNKYPSPTPGKRSDEMYKEMPEYPLDPNELVYPGEGSPFNSQVPRYGSTPDQQGKGNPPHPAAPLMETPRSKLYMTTVEITSVLDSLTGCVTACEHCAAHCRDRGEHRTASCLTTSKACADICILMHTYIASSHHAEIALLSKQLSEVCARVCETCALECGKHPDMQACITCEAACRECAAQCRRYAR